MTGILLVGDDAIRQSLFEAAGVVDRVQRVDSLEEAFALRSDRVRARWAGIVVDSEHYAEAMRAAELRDGLASAVGFADTLAFAGSLPGAYAFCARVGGVVAAFRESMGRDYALTDGAVIGSGPEAWAGLAALTQVRVSKLTVHAEPFDAVTPAVAHRLGIDILTADADSFATAPVIYSARELAVILKRPDRGLVIDESVALHTVAAQVRLLTSKEPDMKAMRAVIAGT